MAFAKDFGRLLIMIDDQHTTNIKYSLITVLGQQGWAGLIYLMYGVDLIHYCVWLPRQSRFISLIQHGNTTLGYI